MSRVATEIAEQRQLLAGPLGSDEIARAKAALAGRRSVRLAGIGSSRHVAAYGAACLEVFTGIPASALAAPGAGIPQPRLGSEDVLVVVSQSGATPALLTLAAAARSAGALVLSLSNTPGSRLDELADIVLPVAAGPETVVPATKSVTRSMQLLRAVAAPVDDEDLARLVAVISALGDGPHPMTHGALPSVVVAGGFAGQAVADEVALKLAEVTGHLATAESLVDYLHGPVAVPAGVLAFLDPADPNAASVAGRADVLTVGPAGDVHLAATGDPSLDAIARVVAGQWLAVDWAISAGLDPDDPRGLEKVTLTA